MTNIEVFEIMDNLLNGKQKKVEYQSILAFDKNWLLKDNNLEFEFEVLKSVREWKHKKRNDNPLPADYVDMWNGLKEVILESYMQTKLTPHTPVDKKVKNQIENDLLRQILSLMNNAECGYDNWKGGKE